MARKDVEKARDDEEEDDRDEAADADARGDGEEVARDESTKGVAKALGVDPDDDEEEAAEGEAAASDEQEEPVKNRAARRREQALARKGRGRRDEGATDKKRARAAADDEAGEGDGEGDEAEDEDEDEDAGRKVARAKDAALPKDKNARAKELLRRRREAVEKKGAIGLSASEVVSDQLARAASRTGTWFQKNFKKIVAGVSIGLAAAVGSIYYLQHQAEKNGQASDDLSKAVAAEYGYIFNEDRKDPRSEEAKKSDPIPTFANASAKTDAILAAYTDVTSKHQGRPLALLAKVGQAGAQLEKGEYDAALAGYDDVLKSELAKADVDLRGRALEGKGFALEGKKDWDGALAAYGELEKVDKSFEDQARYAQARMHFKKGDKAKAKELLVAIQKKLEVKPKEARALKASVDEYLMLIDPTAVPKRRPLGGPGGMPSQEEIERMIQEQMKKKGKGGDPHGDEEDEEGPMPMPVPGGPNGSGDGTH